MSRNSHAMMVEGRGRRGKVKKSKKGSGMSRKINALKRQVWNVLGGVGLIAVVLVLGWLAMGGG